MLTPASSKNSNTRSASASFPGWWFRLCGLVLVWLVPWCVLADAEKNRDNVFVMGVFGRIPTRLVGDSAISAYLLTRQGIEIEYINIPAARTRWAVLGGIIDGMSYSDAANFDLSKLIQSKYPIRVYDAYVYYKINEQWRPSWPPQAGFKDAQGATFHYPHLPALGLPHITLVSGHLSGVLMVNTGRVDFYVDVFNRSSSPVGPYIKYPEDGYRLEYLFPSPVRMLFADNERGRKFKKIYDDGIADLSKTPDLFEKIYMGPYSNRESYPAALQSMYNSYIHYLSSQFPELNPHPTE